MANPSSEQYKVEFPFKCQAHESETASFNVYDLVHRGTPVCEECGDDMVLVEPEE